MRDLEVENGGNAPRIHSMDDYFMTEVEKVCQLDLDIHVSCGSHESTWKVCLFYKAAYCYHLTSVVFNIERLRTVMLQNLLAWVEARS